MGALPIILTVVGIGGLLALAIYYGAVMERRHREMLQRITVRLDARYYKEDPFDLAARHEDRFATLRQGSNRYAEHVIHGDHECGALWLFEHHHETYSHSKNGRQTHHHRRTFALFESDIVFHAMEVRPEGFFDKVKAAFGFDDIDFESAEFSKNWFVRSADRKFAFDVFHPEMIEFFLRVRSLYLHSAGPFVMFEMGSGTLDEQRVATTLRHATGFFERLPRYLRKDRAR